MGLDRGSSTLLNTASGGSFLHVSTNVRRSILTKMLENIPEEVEEEPLEEKFQIAKPESLLDPSLTLVIPNP